MGICLAFKRQNAEITIITEKENLMFLVTLIIRCEGHQVSSAASAERMDNWTSLDGSCLLIVIKWNPREEEYCLIASGNSFQTLKNPKHFKYLKYEGKSMK